MLADELEAILPKVDPVTGELLSVVKTLDDFRALAPILVEPIKDRFKIVQGANDTARDLSAPAGPVLHEWETGNKELWYAKWWTGTDTAAIYRQHPDGSPMNLLVMERTDPTRLVTTMRIGPNSESDFLRQVWWDIGIRTIWAKSDFTDEARMARRGYQVVQKYPNGRVDIQLDMTERPTPGRHEVKD